MPNTRRFHVPNIPQHVVQRGNNRQPCFLVEDDYHEYYLRLGAASKRYGVAIHAYALMPNHLHLLATPESEDGVQKLMQAVGSGYVRSFNAKHERTGTLWEGRYFSSLVGSEAYLWNCYRYIELNPVRASIVREPGLYRWSSFGRNAYGHRDEVVRPHPAYSALASGSHDPTETYRQFFAEALAPAVVLEIRERLRKERGYGSEEFLASVEAIASRSPRCRTSGRPRKSEDDLTISDLFIRSRIGA